MASAAERLPPDWEAVEDGQGRTYYWNTLTDETSWVVPEVVKAKASVAESYVSNAAGGGGGGSPGGSGGAVEQELAALRGSSVASLTSKFGNASIEKEAATPPSKSTDATAEIASSKSKAMSVSAISKYKEAKAAEEAAKQGGGGGGRPAPPPKVNIYE